MLIFKCGYSNIPAITLWPSSKLKNLTIPTIRIKYIYHRVKKKNSGQCQSVPPWAYIIILYYRRWRGKCFERVGGDGVPGDWLVGHIGTYRARYLYLQHGNGIDPCAYKLYIYTRTHTRLIIYLYRYIIIQPASSIYLSERRREKWCAADHRGTGCDAVGEKGLSTGIPCRATTCVWVCVSALCM